MKNPSNGENRIWSVKCSECGEPVRIAKRDTVVVNGERQAIVRRATCSACLRKAASHG